MSALFVIADLINVTLNNDIEQIVYEAATAALGTPLAEAAARVWVPSPHMLLLCSCPLVIVVRVIACFVHDMMYVGPVDAEITTV